MVLLKWLYNDFDHTCFHFVEVECLRLGSKCSALLVQHHCFRPRLFCSCLLMLKLKICRINNVGQFNRGLTVQLSQGNIAESTVLTNLTPAKVCEKQKTQKGA